MVGKTDRSFRRTRQFGGETYVVFEHSYNENQAEHDLKEKRDHGFNVRKTEGKIEIRGKPQPYFELWMLKSQYLKWNDDFDTRMYGKHKERIQANRGYTGQYRDEPIGKFGAKKKAKRLPRK